MTEIHLPALLLLATFALIAVASRQIGEALARIHLPLITGFLLTGILAGPFILGLVPREALPGLRFLDEISLAFIAFAAGAELSIDELRRHFRSIRWMTVAQVSITFGLGAAAVVAFADAIPFARELPTAGRVAVGLLAGSVLVARSPSSAIALITELRARGPLTRMVLGVTVVIDVVVIVLFAVSTSMADALLDQSRFDPSLVALVLAEVTASILLGLCSGWLLLPAIAALRAPAAIKAGLLLGAGWGIYAVCRVFRAHTLEHWPVEVLLEPLLVCMVAGFAAVNFSSFRADLRQLVGLAGPPVYVVFFTLAGAALGLDVLRATWKIALLLFAVRVVGIAAGSLLGGTLAGDPPRLNRISWMTFITQAGIGLGLAKEVAAEFPEWGEAFATTLISVIVVNQVVGPPLFKWAFQIAGEARVRVQPAGGRGAPLALIFGLESQALTLARQLSSHGWQARVVTRRPAGDEEPPGSGVDLVRVHDHTAESLAAIGADRAAAFVCLLGGEESRQLCSLAYERFGVQNVVVLSHEREYWDDYRALGATIVDPAVAMVSLLDHFVRTPSAAELLLGLGRDQDVADFEVRNPDLDGLALRDLRLPLDSLVLSVSRDGASLISHGYTRLELGDRVTVVGSPASLDEVASRFGS